MQRFFSTGKGSMMRSIALSLVFSTLFIAVSVGAATTISTSITTGGTLSVTGASTLTGLTTMVYASSTGQSLSGNVQVAGNILANGYATTTGSNGNIATAGTLTVVGTSNFTGRATLVYASSTGQSLSGNLTVTGTTGLTGLTTMVYASSTTQSLTGNLLVDGNSTLGDAQADTLTVNAGTITHGNAATTTIPSLDLGAWAIATSSAPVPFVRFDTSNYRVGIGTTSPGRTLGVAGNAVFTGNVNVEGTFSPSQTSATAFTVATTLTVTGRADLNGQASTTRLSAFDRIYVGGTASSTIRGDNAASTLPYASSTSITTTGGSWFATDGGNNSVGVGTTTPGATFSVHGNGLVSGTLSAAAFIATSSTITLSGLGIDLLTSINSSGNLISTSTPTAARYLATSSIASSFPYASTTAITATTASTTNLIVGGNSTNGTLAGLIFGTCDIAQRSLLATTTGGFACANATGVTTSFKVFVMATSTLAGPQIGAPRQGFAVVAASSTGINTIGVELSNLTGDNNTPAGTLNFWAVR